VPYFFIHIGYVYLFHKYWKPGNNIYFFIHIGYNILIVWSIVEVLLFCVGMYWVLWEHAVPTDEKKYLPGFWEKSKKKPSRLSYSAL
jgi:hypothetical protein